MWRSSGQPSLNLAWLKTAAEDGLMGKIDEHCLPGLQIKSSLICNFLGPLD